MRNCELMLDSARKVYSEIFDGKICSFLTIGHSELPEKAGVYVIWIKDTEEVLYVGRQRNILDRIATFNLSYVKIIMKEGILKDCLDI